jgi:hypothetical protein
MDGYTCCNRKYTSEYIPEESVWGRSCRAMQCTDVYTG